MRWKDSEYYGMVRFQEFKLVDFLSYVGGILGLFAGISLLSMFELSYFLTLRLLVDLKKFSNLSYASVKRYYREHEFFVVRKI